LRVPPIYSGQKITHLRLRDRHNAIRQRGPYKTTPFKTTREQAGTLAIMPNHLQQIAPFPAEAKKVTAQRVFLQNLLHA
jgi:hypothetical protein